LKDRVNYSNELFENLLVQFSKQNNANYNIELKILLRDCLVNSDEICSHWSSIFLFNLKSSTDLAEYLLTKNMNPLVEKESFVNSIKKIQEIIPKILSGNLKEKFQKLPKEKMKVTQYLFSKLTDVKSSSNFSIFYAILFFIFFIATLLIFSSWMCSQQLSKTGLKEICAKIPKFFDSPKK
jgi:hypothetical protein